MRPRALVTGGSAGLGAAFVADLLAQGFDLVSIDRYPPLETRPNVHAIRANLGGVAGLTGLIAMLDADASFDVVLLNAGISAVGAFEDIGVDHLERLIAINLNAPMELTRLAGGRVSNRASFIFIGSLSNCVGYPGASVYAATKQGIEAFATALRKTGKHAVLCVPARPARHRTRHPLCAQRSQGRRQAASNVPGKARSGASASIWHGLWNVGTPTGWARRVVDPFIHDQSDTARDVRSIARGPACGRGPKQRSKRVTWGAADRLRCLLMWSFHE